MWILNLGKPVNIPVLSQEMAIELGANLLGESVIFIIGAGLLIVEYNRYFHISWYITYTHPQVFDWWQTLAMASYHPGIR